MYFKHSILIKYLVIFLIITILSMIQADYISESGKYNKISNLDSRFKNDKILSKLNAKSNLLKTNTKLENKKVNSLLTYHDSKKNESSDYNLIKAAYDKNLSKWKKKGSEDLKEKKNSKKSSKSTYNYENKYSQENIQEKTANGIYKLMPRYLTTN